MDKKIAIISCILENPTTIQNEFNKIVSQFKNIIKGRMGIPFNNENISVISITVVATLDEINSFTGKLGLLNDVLVKTAISKKSIND